MLMVHLNFKMLCDNVKFKKMKMGNTAHLANPYLPRNANEKILTKIIRLVT